jgi:hypothetical protein
MSVEAKALMTWLPPIFEAIATLSFAQERFREFRQAAH